MNGIAATRDILAARAQIGILIVTMVEADASVFAAMRAGASGRSRIGRRQAFAPAQPASAPIKRRSIDAYGHRSMRAMPGGHRENFPA